MKVFAFLVFLFVWVAGPLEARAGLCITGTHTYDSTTQRFVPQGPADQLGAQFYQASGPQFYYSSAPRCESIQTLKNVSMVLGVSLQIGAITALCTGAGLPVTIALEVGSAALLVADGILDNIDCIDEENEELIEQKAREAVCSEFMSYGIPCRGGRSEKLGETDGYTKEWLSL